MLRYDIAALAKRRKGTVQPLPAIHGGVGAEVAYLRALRAMLREMAAYTREQIVPAAEIEIRAKRAESRLTADMGSEWFEQLAEMAVRLSIVAEQTVARILGLEARRHTTSFMASAKRSLGVDLTAVVREEDLADALRDAAIKNAKLIKGLADDVTRRVSVTVMNAVISGTPAQELRRQLTKGFGISDRRAKLIARNEIATLTSQLNKLRQQQAGITHYVYVTSHDERVRPLHRDHDGKTFSWRNPPSDGHPGTAVNCRCIARAIVEF